ncbi:MAG: alkaline phosphatase family protein [bacterium]|nr:alkaline phosphatase family protein [bacterium]
MLLTFLLVIVGIITAFCFIKIYQTLRYLSFFRAYFRTLLSSALLIILVYGGFVIVDTLHRLNQKKVASDLNTALPTDAKVLFLGFDAGTWDAINPLVKAGKMPNFARLMEGAVTTRLKTNIPTLSSILWTTIATGKLQNKHGVNESISIMVPRLNQNVITFPRFLGAYQVADYLSRHGVFDIIPMTSTARHTKAIWNILTDYQKRVGIVGWWGSFPPEPVNGVVISDHSSMEKTEMGKAKGLYSQSEAAEDAAKSSVYPPELSAELDTIAAQTQSLSLEELNYFIAADSAKLTYVNTLTGWDRTKIECILKMSYLTDKYFKLCTEHLLDKESFDLLTAYFFETDAIAHCYWQFRDGVSHYFPRITPDDLAKYRDVVDNAYINADRILGSIMEHVPEDTHIIIISDHGFELEKIAGSYCVRHEYAPDGILLMRGPYFNPNAKFTEPPHLQDITPTILTLLGIPIGADMDGRVLKEVFNGEFLEKYPLRTIPSHDRGQHFRARATLSAEDQILRDKLRSLGYIQ